MNFMNTTQNSSQNLFCQHERWKAKLIPLSDGRPSLREFCVSCGQSSSGSRLGFALPMISDADILLPSFKHNGKTLGEIAKVDLPYLKWIVLEAKTSSRIKKSAARVYCGIPYVSPKEGEEYDRSICYSSVLAWDCIKKIHLEKQEQKRNEKFEEDFERAYKHETEWWQRMADGE